MSRVKDIMRNLKLILHILETRKTSRIPTTIVVEGQSMLPTLKEGDRVTIIPQPCYMVDDIVLFKYAENQLLMHRVIDVNNQQYLLKGDNAIRIERVTIADIFGKVCRHPFNPAAR